MYATIDRYTGQVITKGHKTYAEACNAQRGFRTYIAQRIKGCWIPTI